MTGTAIVVRGLVKTYAGRRVAADLDLDVERGEVFALLGPNGAGKTTTTEILERYRARDAGEVCVLGAVPGVTLTYPGEGTGLGCSVDCLRSISFHSGRSPGTRVAAR